MLGILLENTEKDNLSNLGEHLVCDISRPVKVVTF